MAIYGVIVAIILQTKVSTQRPGYTWLLCVSLMHEIMGLMSDDRTSCAQIEPAELNAELGLYDKYAMYSGFSIFGAGVTCGFANLVCG